MCAWMGFISPTQEGFAKGQGQCTYPDGSLYRGQWNAGVPNGEGVLELPNGERFEGTFENGLFDGMGVWIKCVLFTHTHNHKPGKGGSHGWHVTR